MASHQQGQDEGPVAHLGDTRAHSLDRPRSSGSRPSLSAHTRPEAGPRNSDVSGTSDFVRATAEHLAEVDSRLKPTRHGSADPTPGFAHIDGDVAGSGTGYNETKVDVVCVTCPGADPVETWTRDPLPDGYFDHEDEDDGGDDPAAAVKASMHNGGAIKELAGDAILSPAINRHLPRAGQLWVRQGIRKYVSTARVMLYRHRELGDGTDIASLADDLLGRVLKSREGLNPSRPLFFIAHSVGGLVVKQALLKSSKDDAYRSILYNCHGVTFFATPHRGSSYLSMKILSQSIQEIMRLQHPLPHSLAHELKLGNPQLQKLHDEFCDIASELQIWTFYETIDSQLSGSGSGWGAGAGAAVSEVQFSAPLCSIKSGLVGVRQEQVYSLDSDHAHCASFGPGNPRTMRSYLHRLAAAVRKAEELSDLYVHTPLRLPEHVKVELVGFYDDPDADAETAVRLYVARYHLAEFMQKGPERCLEERLAKVKRRGAFASMTAGRTRAATEGAEASRSGGNSGLGIWTNVQRMFHPGAAEDSAPPEGPEPQPSPDIVVTRPSPAAASRSLPAEAMRRVQSLTVPPLSTPGFDRPASRASQGTASTMSEPILEETSPKSDRKTAEAETESAIVPVSGTEAKEFDKSQHQQLRAERLSQGSALRDLTAGFSRPDPTQRKFMWIHLPFTNPLWVKDIFNKIGETQRHDFSRLFNTEHWVSKHVQGRHSRSQPSFVKPACNLIPSDPLPSPKPPAGGTTTVSKPRSPRLLYVYLPYLHFDTYLNVLRRRYIVQKRMSHGRARPVPKEIAELESLEARVIWQDQGFDPPLNMRRTLDQFGYPSLQDTYARDDDQMLYKLTKESGPVPPVQRLQQQQQQAGSGSGAPPDKLGSVKRLGSIPLTPGSGDLDGEKAGKKARFDDYVESDIDAEADGYKEGNVLMVDQLWLWAIDTSKASPPVRDDWGYESDFDLFCSETLATFFPKRESRPKEGPLFQQADLRNSVYNELNGDLTGHIDNALDLAAFIVLHAVTVLLDRTSHPDLEIFRIFEEAIGLLTERMTSSLKSFRMQTWKQINIDDSDDPDDPEGASSASIKRRHKRELEQAERENREHTSALLELRDLEDELTTLHKLFETQAAVVEAMRNNSCPPEGSGSGSGSGDDGLTAHGRAYLAEALASLDEYRAQTVEMLRRVDTTRKDYEKLLEMAQRQAQVDDVRWSRIQTELASAQNRSIMVFTTFTIIFLPLSFFTSVFGMNTLEWGGESNLPLSTIGSISLPLSAVLIVGSLVAAFSFRVQSVFTRVYRYSKKIVEGGKGYARRLEPQGARDAKARRRVDRERAEYLAARSKDRSYDFWATVRRQRTSEYRIPDVNRKLETGRSTLTPSTWRSKWT